MKKAGRVRREWGRRPKVRKTPRKYRIGKVTKGQLGRGRPEATSKKFLNPFTSRDPHRDMREGRNIHKVKAKERKGGNGKAIRTITPRVCKNGPPPGGSGLKRDVDLNA